MEEENEQPVDLRPIGQAILTGVNAFAESMALLCNQIAEAIQPVVESVAEVVVQVVESVHSAYIEDGAIYGDTQEGLLRWMEEKGKIVRLRMEADRLEDYHQVLRVFHQRLLEKAEGD